MDGDVVPVPASRAEAPRDEVRTLAYFARCADGPPEHLAPQPIALSGWGDAHMRGSAVTGALARSAEGAGRRRPDLRPARFTADLQRAPTMSPVSIESTVVREGRRLLLVDSELVQDGGVVARARTLFLAEAADAAAEQPWSPGRSPAAPPHDLRPVSETGYLYFSDGRGWTANAGDHRNCARKQVWCRPVPVVRGEELSSFQAAAAVADLTNLVTHWEGGGVRHINADVTLVLGRLPDQDAIGLSAAGRAYSGTVSVGSGEMYDRRGVFGFTTVSAIVQPGRRVDTVSHLMGGLARSEVTREQP